MDKDKSLTARKELALTKSQWHERVITKQKAEGDSLKRVVKISCGEWRPGEKFSGIRFELNSNFAKSRGPWFYKQGKQIAFPLFDDEFG